MNSLMLMLMLAVPSPGSRPQQEVDRAAVSDSPQGLCECGERAGTANSTADEYEKEVRLLGARVGQLVVKQFVPRLFRSEAEVEIFARGFREGALGMAVTQGVAPDVGESRLLELQWPWRKQQSERAEAFVKEAGKRPGAVLLEKGVVLVFQRKGSRPLPADEGGSFEVRMRTLKQDGKLVRARPHERMTRSGMKEMPDWFRQAAERLRIGGSGRLYFPPGVLKAASPSVAEWEAGIVELELLDGGGEK